MAPSMSSSRELAIASRKRPSSPTLSESESLSDFSESPSDFETPNNPSRKPVKKKARTTKAPTASSKGEVGQKIPKEYQSEEGNPLFSVKWYKEVTKREAFWADFKKKVPKSVWAKRFKVELSIGLDEEGVKSACVSEKTSATAGKTRQTTGARKATRKPAKGTSTVDLATDLGVTEDAPIISTEDAEDEKGQTQSRDSIMLSDDIKLDERAAESFQVPTSTEPTEPRENDDLISRALADPYITAEQRASYISIREHQEHAARLIEMEVEEKNRQEQVRQKREAVKERKAAKEANAEAEEAEEVPNIDESGQKQRKPFNPTKF